MLDAIDQTLTGLQNIQGNFQIVLDNQLIISESIITLQEFINKRFEVVFICMAVLVIFMIIILVRQGQAMGMIQKLIIENRKLHEQLASKGVRMNERTYE